MVLCYEDRHDWERSSTLPMASEASRFLAPKADIELAVELVSANGIEAVFLPLMSVSPRHIVSTLERHAAPMLWNVTDGLTVFRGSLIPSFGRILRVPALGSDTYVQGICQNKHHWRAVLEAHGVDCLPGAVIRSGEPDEYQRVTELRPPLFVKTATYGNNTGFALVDPIAPSQDDAFAKASRLLHGGLGPILIEEYASGKEYSVWCFETQIWQAFVFEKVTDLPYLTNDVKDKTPHSGQYRLEPCDAKHIESLSVYIVNILGIHDYVRLDIRECEKGNSYPIDINTGAFLVGRSFEMACRACCGSKRDTFAALVEASWNRQNTSMA